MVHSVNDDTCNNETEVEKMKDTTKYALFLIVLIIGAAIFIKWIFVDNESDINAMKAFCGDNNMNFSSWEGYKCYKINNNTLQETDIAFYDGKYYLVKNEH